MVRLEVVSDVLPVNVDISILSTLEVVEGDRQAGEVIFIMADTDCLRSVDR